MTILESTYAEIDKNIEALCESGRMEDYVDNVAIIHLKDGGVVVASEPAWRITDKDLIVLEGLLCDKTTEDGSFDPSCSVSLIYENTTDDKFDPSKWIYIEQDAPGMTINNFIHFKTEAECENCRSNRGLKQTNEEWMRQANTEQLAKAIIFFCPFPCDICEIQCKDGGECTYNKALNTVIKWLKQPRTDLEHKEV